MWHFGGDGAANPYVGAGAGGVWYEGHGTSFAAPLVTHSVGVLLPEASTRGSAVDFLRAMAVHFAEPTELPVEEVGHGRFRSDLRESLASGPDGRQVLATALFARTEVLGFEQMIYELTPDAIELGLAAALPAVFELSCSIAEFGRGERSGAEPLRMIVRIVVRDIGRRLAATG